MRDNQIWKPWPNPCITIIQLQQVSRHEQIPMMPSYRKHNKTFTLMQMKVSLYGLFMLFFPPIENSMHMLLFMYLLIFFFFFFWGGNSLLSSLIVPNDFVLAANSLEELCNVLKTNERRTVSL